MDFLQTLEYTKKLNVLYIDDDKLYQKNIRNMLSVFFQRVDTACDEHNALCSFEYYFLDQNSYYDIVFIDVQIDSMNSEILINKLKNFNAKQKFIGISEYSETSIIKYINLGIKEYLYKPLDKQKMQQCFSSISKELVESKKREPQNTNNFLIDNILQIPSEESHFGFLH